MGSPFQFKDALSYSLVGEVYVKGLGSLKNIRFLVEDFRFFRSLVHVNAPVLSRSSFFSKWVRHNSRGYHKVLNQRLYDFFEHFKASENALGMYLYAWAG